MSGLTSAATRRWASASQRCFRRIVLLIPLICGLLLSPRGHSADEQLQFDPFLGYDGIVHEASWFPVIFELKNMGPPFVGTIELSSGSLGGGHVRRTTVELPTGTQKRVLLPAFSNSRYGSVWKVKLVDEKGKTRAEAPPLQPRKQVASETLVLGSLSKTLAGAPVFPAMIRSQPEAQPVVARLQPDLLPDNPIVFEGLDAIYLHGERARDLRVNQEKALFSWIMAGGHLIVGLEQPSEANANPFLRALLPCEGVGTTTLPAGDIFSDWISRLTMPPARSTSKSKSLPAFPASIKDHRFSETGLPVVKIKNRDGKIILGTADLPLILEANRGRGKITVLTFSPELEPFRSWEGRDYFWARLLNLPWSYFSREDHISLGGYGLDGVFGSMVETTQVRKLPLSALLLLLVVYLLVIGPLDRYWLKKMGKEMLTWITFPCYVAAFSALIYLIGYKLRAGDSEWNEIHLVDIVPRGQEVEWRGKTYGSLYSPANARYTLSSERPHATLRSEFSGNYSQGQESHGTISQRGNTFFAEMEVPVWTSQLFVSDWVQPGAAPLVCSIESKGNQWEVQVENQLNRPLSKLHLVLEEMVYSLGDLAASEKKKVFINQNKGKPLSSFVTEHGHAFETVVQNRRHAIGSDYRVTDFPMGSMAASFISKVDRPEHREFVAPAGLDLTRVHQQGNAIVMAWAGGYLPGKAMNQFTPRRQRHDTLFRVGVSVTRPAPLVSQYGN